MGKNTKLHIEYLEKWIPNCVDDIDDLHCIFEIEFIDKEIGRIIALSTYTIAYTDNLLIITFQKCDFINKQTKQRKVLSEEQIKEAFNHKQKIKLNVYDRTGEIVKIYEFNDCELNCITDNVYDYRLDMNTNRTSCLVFTYASKNATNKNDYYG
jgi:hypothetical protein